MSYRFKLSAAAMLTGALLLSGCASTGMSPSTPNNQVNNNYQLPQEIYEGYWAMTSKINGQAGVVSFRDGMTYNYRFKCNADGSYQQVAVEKYKLKPNPTAVGLQYENEPVFSEIKVVRLAPKQVLMLNQSYSDPELQRVLPDGQEYAYIYKPTLEPLCSL
ncbi:hypothetical protein [Psychrobacter jeotgali]|uniref:hypothetical protein n=1 Tax=Psychrobacter jeotgali TaxID=179010 RepID=UPI0019180C2F|nr:hypothetical protein [Psychrobacter jeotgali]